MRRPPIVWLLAVALSGCAQPMRKGPIIDRYTRAACIPVRSRPAIQPPTRAWDYALKLRDGISVHVAGAAAGGRIDVTFMPEGTQQVVGNAGDYIYPADVRVDDAGERLYVRASGQRAAFGEAQTWLFDYDLRATRQLSRALVDPNALPEVCPETR